MKPYIPALIICILFPGATLTAAPLKTLAVANTKATVQYDPSLSKVIDKEYYPRDDYPYPLRKLITTRLSRDDKRVFLIEFDPGQEADHRFKVSLMPGDKEDKGTPAGSMYGTELAIPGDGHIYVGGETNDYYNKRRIYSLGAENKFREDRQPAYYIGMTGSVQGDVTLYADSAVSKKLLTVEAGTELTLLLEMNGKFLAKTGFGIVGWLQSPSVVTGYRLHAD